MNPRQKWTVMQVEADVHEYGGKRTADAHNKLVDICANLQSELAEVYSLLPAGIYMDPPDGGDVSPLEQMRRMAEDAKSWRELQAHRMEPYRT